MTSAEARRVNEIDQATEALELRIDSAMSGQRFEARAERVRQPTERPIDDGHEPYEDRSEYDRWPVERAADFFSAIQSFSKTRTLPANMDANLRDVFGSALEGRSITGMGTLVDQDGGFLVPQEPGEHDPAKSSRRRAGRLTDLKCTDHSGQYPEMARAARDEPLGQWFRWRALWWRGGQPHRRSRSGHRIEAQP